MAETIMNARNKEVQLKPRMREERNVLYELVYDFHFIHPKRTRIKLKVLFVSSQQSGPTTELYQDRSALYRDIVL